MQDIVSDVYRKCLLCDMHPIENRPFLPPTIEMSDLHQLMKQMQMFLTIYTIIRNTHFI